MRLQLFPSDSKRVEEGEPMQDQFADIARDYDRMFPRDLEADRLLFVSLFQRHRVKTVLDCACGTGIHFEILAREGFDVTGSDASDAMLEVARSRVAAGLEVRLLKSTWSELPDIVPGKYDAVICMGNSLPLEPDDEAAAGSLRGMYAMLNAGGVLVVANANADRQLEEKVRIRAVEPEPECFLLSVRDYGSRRTTHRYFFIDAGSGEPSMRYYRFELMNLTAEKMEALAARAGIDDFSLHGDENLSYFSPDYSERLIFVAENPRKADG